MRFANNDIVSNPGERIKILYSPVVLKDGSFELVESGKEDIQEYINSHEESTDIRIIMERIKQGDTSVLAQRQPMYGDFTDMPSSYAEFLQLQIDSENMYNSLTAEQKQAFNNDKNQFFAQSGTEEWLKKLGWYKEEIKVEEGEVNE